MRKIFISAGHANKSGRDRGSSGNGYIEGELSVELRDLIMSELSKLGVTAIKDGNDTILKDSIAFFKRLVSPDSILIDLHWNAFNEKSTGVETIVPEKYTALEYNLAKALSAKTSEILGIPLRGKNGVKTESESQHPSLGWMRLTGENVLLEVCFISNPNDMKSYQKNKIAYSKAIAKVLYEFAGGTTTNEKTTTYSVKSGDTLTKIAVKFNTTITKLKTDNKLTTDIIKIGQVLKV